MNSVLLRHDAALLDPDLRSSEIPKQSVGQDAFTAQAALAPVVLCGGTGTRLWPLSRESYPKQLMSPFGGETLLQSTLRRVENLSPGQTPALAPLVLCSEETRFLTAEQLRASAQPTHGIVLEPCGRNTAPALTLACLILGGTTQRDPVLLVMPADHVIQDVKAFHAAVNAGWTLALQGQIVTFGIVPDAPETGYGYIRAGGRIGGAGTALRAEAFVEKPDAQTARHYVESGRYFWNAGIFLLRPSVWLRAIGKFRPDILRACRMAAEALDRDQDFLRIGREAFSACPADSIDYAVMEKVCAQNSNHVAVVPLDAGWSDVGAWDAVWKTSARDVRDNAVQGDVIAIDTRGSLLLAQDRLLACVGLEDMVVVETPDAVMVARKDRTQDVKAIVEQLRAVKRTEHVSHRKVFRPWGSYDSVDEGKRFQVKRIVVNPGASLSLQMHHHRAEHWIVVCGTAEVTRGTETILLTENQSTYIPLGVTHRLSNPGRVPLEIIEVQSGAYLGEDDIIRFDDRYGRVGG
ncbi:MAG: mannose-1-phosphate guanylyltransferase/mannose-6-phosphate isomerase [Burkholderiales bacterium]